MKNPLFNHKIILAIFAGAAFTISPAAIAQEKGVVFAGGSVGEASATFAGAVVALPGADLGRGLAVRVVAGRSNYRYDAGTVTVRGRADTASLAEIGYCCGYADQPHFQRDFRRALNMSPGEYRRVAIG